MPVSVMTKRDCIDRWLQRVRFRAPVVLIALLLAGQLAGAEGDTPDFARLVRPIFASRCLACHGTKKQTSGLRLDEGPAALAGGDSGLAIVPGKASASPL